LNEFSDYIHRTKYRGRGESFEEAMSRVAGVLAKGDEYHPFRDILLAQRFLPAGRIQTAIGSTEKSVTPYNCYVSGKIEDSFVAGSGSVMGRCAEAAQTMRLGGGIGYDFSTLRPRGDMIRKLGSQSSGPVSFMGIFDAICRCIASSGHRRGAQMGVLRVDHPDIEEFIRAKQNTTNLTGFNVSIAITDEFMKAVIAGSMFELRFGGVVYREVDARALWEMIMRSTWDWAEPGVLFIDTINKMNNLWYCETIAATNPCGEQPLPPFGACLLGSFNMVKYVRCTGSQHLPSRGYYIDFDQFRADIHRVVRAMDNVIDVARYPIHEQEEEARSKRRMGLGVTGLANAIEVLGHDYGSPEFLDTERQILKALRDETYRASALLAKEKGAFPMFNRELYLQGLFIQHLPEDIQVLISEHGIRNSHLTSIAPTGTISLTADNVSSGIEPVFAYETKRTVIEFDGPREFLVKDYGIECLSTAGMRAEDVKVSEHLSVLIAAQEFVDSAVSKTLNVPHDVSWEDFKRVYIDAWIGGAKGCTTYRVGGSRAPVLESRDEAVACRIDPATGERSCE
jgi:ribonucleoside-diphosphate reductase alpha chain